MRSSTSRRRCASIHTDRGERTFRGEQSVRVGAESGPFRHLFAWFIAIGTAVVVVALATWIRQQDLARRAAETRADVAESRLADAETTLTAIARTTASASATARATANLPETALRRALELVFEAYKDPTEARMRMLSDAFSPDALSFERTEAEHLISGGLHLAGNTPFVLDVLGTAPRGTDDVEIKTHELWTYDEIDAQNRRIRCVREESEQIYVVRRNGANWLIQDVQLAGATRRDEC